MRDAPSLPSLLLFCCVAAAVTGCALETDPAGPPPANRAVFNDQVYGLLLRDCGFPQCHGSLSMEEARFFRIYGPGRTRLDPETDPLAPLTEAEREATFERARSMLAGAERAEDTLLVRKPLAVDAGGAPHMGRTALGNDVYTTPEDDGYQTLLRWAQTAFPEGG